MEAKGIAVVYIEDGDDYADKIQSLAQEIEAYAKEYHQKQLEKLGLGGVIAKYGDCAFWSQKSDTLSLCYNEPQLNAVLTA